MRVRWFNIVLLVTLVVGLPLFSVQGAPAPSERVQAQTAPQQAGEQPAALPQQVTDYETALAKLHPALREALLTASAALKTGTVQGQALSTEPLIVQVVADPGAELKAYFEPGSLIERPALAKNGSGMQMLIGKVQARDLGKLASVAAVQTVLPIELSRNGQPLDYPADDTAPAKTPTDWATLRANATKLRGAAPDWADARAMGDGTPLAVPEQGMLLAADPHNVQQAWHNGYTGEGVTVAVLDDGIDTAHPDLMGTQRLYASPANPQYNGWPVAFSPFSMLLWAMQASGYGPYITYGYTGATYADTSTTPSLRAGAEAGTSVFEYTPLIDFASFGFEHTYTIADSMSKSGVVHLGTHPDVDLRDYVWGELVAILVTDPNTAGVYDTVYVDLDDDYDFRDEKPLTKAVLGDPSTYNNMISYRDLNSDGLADLSGGSLYFIADGVNVIPGSDWLYGATSGGFMCPTNGDLVAFSGASFGYDYSHGTQCASAIAARGVVNAKVPEFQEGSVVGAVIGVAPAAKLVDISDIYWNFDSSKIDAYLFLAAGYDGIDQTGFSLYDYTGGHTDTDPIQVASNSYGSSDIDYDGWDYDSQLVSQLMRWWAPYQQYTFSTGNGGPGYGTAAPPSPDTAVAVGASTEFSATGWDSITSTQQINMNDVTPFSNKGPGATGRTGVDVVANGAYAPGDEALNYYSVSMWGEPNGDYSWDSWGGTSRSSPVAAGVLALIYDAYRQTTGKWLEGAFAKIMLQSGATDLNYDVFSQGSGSVNAGVSTALAALEYGIMAAVPEGDSATSEWNPGDYQGEDYPGFAHLMAAGETDTTDIMVAGFAPQGPMAPTVARDVELKLIKQDEFDFTITPEMAAGEYANGAENRDNFYKAFQYMFPITAVPGKDDLWYSLDVPADTELMVVRALFPYEEFDANGDYVYDNRYYLMVYNWTDVDGDGIVWDDKDANGTVNTINRPEQIFDWDLIDGGMELEWGDTRNELDRWEYARFSYHRPGGNRTEMWVSDPLERMNDGLFIGLRHMPTGDYTGATHLKFRVEYYSKQDCPWLELTGTPGITVTQGTNEVPLFFEQGVATITADAVPPADMRPGIYQAAIEIDVPGFAQAPVGAAPEQTAPLWNKVIVPVTMAIAEDVPAAGEDWQFGGYETYWDDYNAGRLYNNGAVRGLFDWTWREESGDWRFFFQDLPTTAPAADMSRYLIVRDQWDDPAPMNDIDTVVLGPTESPLGKDWLSSGEPDYYGPYTLQTVAQSPVVRSGQAVWMFNTSSGANEDWVGAPIGDGGLHEILQHHVLFDGTEFDVVFTKTLGLMDVGPDELYAETCANDGYLGEVALSSSIGFSELVVDTYGLSPVESYTGLPLIYADDDLEWLATFPVAHAGKMSFVVDSADVSDLDLYLYYLGPTGVETVEQRSSSASTGAYERIDYMLPEDGIWALAVDNYSGPDGTFDLDFLVIMGYGVEASGYPLGPLPADTPITLDVSYSGAAYLGETGPMPLGVDVSTHKVEPSATGTLYYGMVTLGPAESPSLAVIDLQVLRMLCGPEPVDLQLSVRPATFCPGYNLEYTLVMTNTTSQMITDVVITDALPALTSFVSASGSTGVTGTYNGATNTITWTKASLAPGEVLTARCVLHSYSSMPDAYMLTNTFVYGTQQVSVMAVADTDRCGATPTPTATATATATATPKPSATPTATPQPEFKLYVPLLSRHIS